ncbi:MAG TPA: hypothetical protein VNB91_08075, partial [Jatrophihabitantaceae bacterium]|nr:hypothetical protein [Jatrophihabitantaceae bacterium]
EADAYCSRVNAFGGEYSAGSRGQTKVTPSATGRVIRARDHAIHIRHMPRPPRSIRGRIGAFALAVGFACAPASVVLATDSPSGDHAGAWPSSWRAYLLAAGARVSDVIGDVGCGQGYCDVSSGPSGTLNSVYFNSNGTNAFFRIRLAGDPRKASAGGFQSTTYMLQIAVNGVARVAVGLDGKNPQRDFVYVANADGTAHTEVYATPFNNAGGEFSAGARGLPDGNGQYFIDWQVPLSRITQRSGGAITAYTPVQLFFGTSQSANLAVLNKDFMTGNAVNFGEGSTITLVLPPAVVPVPAPPAAPPVVPPGATPVPAAPAPPADGLPTLPDASMPARPAPIDLAVAVILVVAGFLVLVRPRRPT